MIIMYFVVGLMFFLGIGIKYFKWGFLIAGYNTMSKKEKENVDLDGLCNLMGNYLLLIGLLILGSIILDKVGYKNLTSISFMLIFPLTIILIILAQKYDHNEQTKSKGTETKVVVIITVVMTIGISYFLSYGARDPQVEIMENRVVISGMYGTAIQKDEIIKITLEENIPRVLKKVNGFDLGYALRGNFKLEDMGVGKIYIHENKTPYILIRTEDKYFLINYKDSDKTIELYNKLELTD